MTPLLCILIPMSTAGYADEPAEVKDAVTGAWERTVTSKQGTYHLVKTHLDGKTTLHITGDDGTIVESKTSEYRLSETDEVRIFTYFNNLITAGPSAGARVPGEFAYVYRIDGDRFYEIRGMLKDDDGPVEVIVWARVPQETD
jgi:hypothetical protein